MYIRDILSMFKLSLPRETLKWCATNLCIYYIFQATVTTSYGPIYLYSIELSSMLMEKQTNVKSHLFVSRHL